MPNNETFVEDPSRRKFFGTFAKCGLVVLSSSAALKALSFAETLHASDARRPYVTNNPDQPRDNNTLISVYAVLKADQNNINPDFRRIISEHAQRTDPFFAGTILYGTARYTNPVSKDALVVDKSIDEILTGDDLFDVLEAAVTRANIASLTEVGSVPTIGVYYHFSPETHRRTAETFGYGILGGLGFCIIDFNAATARERGLGPVGEIIRARELWGHGVFGLPDNESVRPGSIMGPADQQVQSLEATFLEDTEYRSIGLDPSKRPMGGGAVGPMSRRKIFIPFAAQKR